MLKILSLSYPLRSASEDAGGGDNERSRGPPWQWHQTAVRYMGVARVGKVRNEVEELAGKGRKGGKIVGGEKCSGQYMPALAPYSWLFWVSGEENRARNTCYYDHPKPITPPCIIHWVFP